MLVKDGLKKEGEKAVIKLLRWKDVHGKPVVVNPLHILCVMVEENDTVIFVRDRMIRTYKPLENVVTEWQEALGEGK